MQETTAIRCIVHSLYDMQKIRIQCGNRIVAAFRVKLGLHSSEAEEENAEASSLLNSLRAEYKRITDGVKRITKTMKIDSPLITSVGELALIESYEHQLKAESVHGKALLEELMLEPIYTEWLSGIRGVGPIMAGVILSEIDFEKATSISALEKYVGIDVVVYQDSEGNTIEEGRGRKASHLVPKTYVNQAGETIETVGISFNPLIKTKLLGVMCDNFIKLNSPYREVYDNYKHRLEHHPKHLGKSKLHRHRMAKRVMLKVFLADLWTIARTIKGLPVRPTYAEEKLGIVHSKPKHIQDWMDNRNAKQRGEAA